MWKELIFLIIKELLEKVIGVQKLCFIEPEHSAFQAANKMVKNRCGALLVCTTIKEKKLKGIITERDLAFRVIPKNLDPKKTKVSMIMTKEVDIISENKTIFEAISMMKDNGYRHLPVTNKKEVVGILSMRDLYDIANNKLQDSIKQHEEFLYGTGYGG